MRMLLRKMNWLLDHLLPGVRKGAPPNQASTEYSLLSREAAEDGRFKGWHDHGVTERQDAAYRSLIQEMYAGQPRQDFLAAAEAVKCHGQPNDLLERLAADEAFGDIDVPAALAPGRFVGRAPQQVDEFLEAVVRPIRQKYSGGTRGADVKV